jgi:hypothetical protein
MRYRQAMGNAFDVLTFLAFAAALGLGVGTVLGVLALVLAVPAHAAGEAAAGRLLLHRPSSESAFAAPLASTETTFRADGPILRVRVVQAFRNPLPDRQEGLYVIELPAHATLDRLAVRVRAEEEEADEPDALEPMEPIASRALLAAVEGADVVSRAIAGIEPGETVLIELEYQQVARYDRGRPGLRMLTQAPLRAWVVGRRRRTRVNPDANEYRSVPLGVEAAWRSSPARGEPGAPWLWLLPVVALYVAVAFFS